MIDYNYQTARNGIERNQGSLGTIVNRASDYNNRVAEPHSAPPKKREFRQDFIAKNPLYEKYQRKLGDGDKQPLLKGDSSGGSSKGQNK